MVQFLPTREIFLQIGQFSIRWYGVLWALAIWEVWYLTPKLQKYRGVNLSRDEWTRIIAWGAVGALVGGRLGYVLFYEPAYFLQNPLDIFALWHGGMASHGGFIGGLVAVWLVTQEPLTLAFTDVLTVPIALALALGRVGNWINGELYLPMFAWLPVVKNLVVAGVCYLHLTRRRGSTTAIFLILYSTLRFLIEPLRVDPWPLTWGLTRGQLFTLPLLLAGVLLWIWARKQPKSSNKPTGS